MNSTIKKFLVIGDPIEHSLSPQIHNSAYKTLGIADKYFFDKQKVNLENLKQFIEQARQTNLAGFSCTYPLKTEILKYLDQTDAAANEIGAVNTVVNENGKFKGYNTDYLGLQSLVDAKIQTIAILGAGGLAQAACYAFKDKKVTIFNRTLKKAKSLANKYNFETSDLSLINQNPEILKNFDLVINTTSIGLRPEDLQFINLVFDCKQHIIETNYLIAQTELLKRATFFKCKISTGYDLLLAQARPQFKLYTSLELPQLTFS